MKLRVCITLVMLVLVSHQVSADIGSPATSTPPRVTLESCGDLRAEDILGILAAEHQNFDYSRTQVLVACSPGSATVRVIGPNNPRGRILHADLSSVQPVAWPRTIALLVAELSPPPDLEAPGLVQAQIEQKDKRTRRRKAVLGVGLQFARTSSAHSSGASRTLFMPLVNANISVPVGKWVGIYGSVSLNNFARYTPKGGSELPLSMVLQEYGVFIPVSKGPLTLDVTYSIVSDRIAIGSGPVGDLHTLPQPYYGMLALGLDASMAWDERTTLVANVARGTTMHDVESGYSVGVGVTYHLRDAFKFEFALEHTSYDGHDPDGSYSHNSTIAGTSLTYNR